MTALSTQRDNRAPCWRRWTDLQSLRASLGSGQPGGGCCIAAAITTAACLGAAGFFTTLMNRYQLYFILGCVAADGNHVSSRLAGVERFLVAAGKPTARLSEFGHWL